MKQLLIALFLLCAISLSAVADIQVTYTGFTTEQQTAFEAAVALWEPLLNSPVPIKINARFQQVPGFVTLFVPNMIRNFAGAPQTNIWYCNALANALTGTELNPGEADMDIIVIPTPDHAWYYGVDGACPASNYDFVTEMFKAVAYGLGYMPSFYVQQGYGSYGMLNPSVLGLTTSFPWEDMQGQPAQYDTFVVNTSGQHLTDTALFPNPSPALNAQLSGGNLRFDGVTAIEYAGNTQPVLYAAAFNLARTARLNGSTYQDTENFPGVPTGILGGGWRFPAPIVLGILQDLGWTLSLNTLLYPPQNLSGVNQNGAVILNWDLPVTDYAVNAIHIYRDGTEIASSSDNLLSYTDYPTTGCSYEYYVKAQYSHGLSEASNSVTVYCSVSAEDQSLIPASDLKLSSAPNPFTNSTSLSCELRKAGDLKIGIFNLKGQKVRHLRSGNLNAGLHKLSWDGKDDQNRPLSSGIYFIQATSNGFTASQTVLLLR